MPHPLTLRRALPAALLAAATIATPGSTAATLSAHGSHTHAFREGARATLGQYAHQLALASGRAHESAAQLTAQLPNQVNQNCIAPAGDPVAGTPAWQLRDTFNQYCATLRLRDELLNPATGVGNASSGATLYADQAQQQVADGPGHIHGGITTLVPGSQAADPMRTLDRWQALTGGRVKRIAFTARDGAQLKGHVFLPPAAVKRPKDGYPGVVITDGSVQGYEQLYYWAAEGLAEAGYQVMTYDVQGQGDSDLLGSDCSNLTSPNTSLSCQGVPYQQSYNFYQGAEDSIGFFDSPANPYFADLNRDKIAMAGHSLGAAAVSEVGQCDTRVKTIVAWDNLNAITSCNGGGETIDPKFLNRGARIRVPALALTNDYLFNPQPATSVPDENAKAAGYRQIVGAGQDSMIVTFRGATHLTYTYVPLVLPASELAERFAFHYTLAWLDRYLRGDRRATQRLTAAKFDGSSDAHSIGAGTYDAARAAAAPSDSYAGNVPYLIKGIPVRNIVSFYYLSEYSLGGRKCLDIRAGCPAVRPPTP